MNIQILVDFRRKGVQHRIDGPATSFLNTRHWMLHDRWIDGTLLYVGASSSEVMWTRDA